MIISRDTRITRSKIGDNRKSIKIESSKCSYPVPPYFSLYQFPPGEDISLLEFDEIAMERLNILKLFENCKDSCKFNSPEFKKRLQNQTKNFKKFLVNPTDDLRSASEQQECFRRDLIGHCILRLAFCRSPENTKWLINIETDLFRYRFLNAGNDNINEAFNHMNLGVEKVPEDEVSNLVNDISNACGLSVEEIAYSTFYKGDFTEAIDLVRRGSVLLKHGIAYFPNEDLVNIVCTRFRAILSAAMARTHKHLAMLEEEGRILPRLARLANNVYDTKQYNGDEASTKITRHMIDNLAIKSFPPCMKHIHANLRLNHHLKHGARRQYGLFLKGIGMSLEEAMEFMRAEFTKKINSDKFDKEYAYNIRYLYGKEGKRIPQNAFSCATIILKNPPSSVDCHGCPFKHLEKSVLEQRLKKDGFSPEQVKKIMGFTETNGYDKACTRFFEFKHKLEEGELGRLITHPNNYYEESQRIILSRQNGNVNNVKEETKDVEMKEE